MSGPPLSRACTPAKRTTVGRAVARSAATRTARQTRFSHVRWGSVTNSVNPGCVAATSCSADSTSTTLRYGISAAGQPAQRLGVSVALADLGEPFRAPFGEIRVPVHDVSGLGERRDLLVGRQRCNTVGHVHFANHLGAYIGGGLRGCPRRISRDDGDVVLRHLIMVTRSPDVTQSPGRTERRELLPL